MKIECNITILIYPSTEILTLISQLIYHEAPAVLTSMSSFALRLYLMIYDALTLKISLILSSLQQLCTNKAIMQMLV